MAKEKKEDLRVIKTKEKLTKALVQLLKEKQIQNIKVSELCDLASVSRATFYNNFDTIDDVFVYYVTKFEFPIDDILSKEVNAIDFSKPDSVSNAWKDYIFPIIAQLEDKKDDLFEILTKQSMNGDFYLAVQDVMTQLSRRLLAVYKKKYDIDVPNEIAVRYTAGGLTDLLLYLVMSGDKYTLEEKQHYIYHVVFEISNYYYQRHQDGELL